MKKFWLQREVIVVYGVSILALAEMVDTTIVNVAIPQIMSALNTNIESIALIFTSYIIAAAIFTPLVGIAIKRFGMKNLTLFSAVVFCVASVLCGMSTSLSEMIFFRYIQGISGAFLPAIAQAYIVRAFAGHERKVMMALFGTVIVMGPVLGPILGSLLTAYFNWRFIFYVNVPVCVIGFFIILFFMKKEARHSVYFDSISFFFLAISMSLLEYFIDQGSLKNWFDSPTMVVIFSLGSLFLLFFIWRGVLGLSVVNLHLFRNRNFIANCIVGFLFTLFATAATTYFPTFLQQIYHYPVERIGFVLAPRGVAAIISGPILLWLSRKIGLRAVATLGIVGFAMSCYTMAMFGPEVGENTILLTMAFQGCTMMAFFIPILDLGYIGIVKADRDDATGIFNFFRNIATSIGTSCAATGISHQFNVSYHELAGHVSLYEKGYIWWSQNLAAAPQQLQIAVANLQVLFQSSLISYLDIFYLFANLLFLISWTPFILRGFPNEENYIRLGLYYLIKKYKHTIKQWNYWRLGNFRYGSR